MAKSKPLKIAAWVGVVVSIRGDVCFLAPQRWAEWYFPPHFVFVVSPRRDDLYYQEWKIKEGFLTDLMKLASCKAGELVLIVQLPLCTSKCGHEAKWVKKKKTVSLSSCSEKQESWCCRFRRTELLKAPHRHDHREVVHSVKTLAHQTFESFPNFKCGSVCFITFTFYPWISLSISSQWFVGWGWPLFQCGSRWAH